MVTRVEIATNARPAPQGSQERLHFERRGNASGAAGAPGAGNPGNQGGLQRINVHGTWYELRFTQIDPENGDRNIVYDNATMGEIAEQVRQLAMAKMSAQEAADSRSFRTLLSRAAPRANLDNVAFQSVKFSRRAMNQANYVDVPGDVVSQLDRRPGNNPARKLIELFVEAERVRSGGKAAKPKKKARSNSQPPQPKPGQGNAGRPAPAKRATQPGPNPDDSGAGFGFRLDPQDQELAQAIKRSRFDADLDPADYTFGAPAARQRQAPVADDAAKVASDLDEIRDRLSEHNKALKQSPGSQEAYYALHGATKAPCSRENSSRSRESS